MRLSTKRVTDRARAMGVLAVLCFAAAPVYSAEDEARVLILNALDPYLPAYQAIDGAMRASLAEQTAKRIVLYSELLDAQRFPGESFEPELVALLSKKYRALPIDVVVTVTQPALDFFNRHGGQLWPGARLVAHGIADPGSEAVTLPSNAVGQVNRDDFAGTIALARRLQPKAGRILVISGVSPLDLELEGRARQAVPAAAGTLPVEYLSGWPLPELTARVAAEPASTIVLYLTQFRDREGRPYQPRQVLREISKASSAPVYGLFETYIGWGVAAGSMEFYADRGQLVAQLVREAVAGKPVVAGQTLFSVSSRCVADARALRRWSLDDGYLPLSCDVRFIDTPVWRKYAWQIAAVLVIFIVQAVLIAMLVVQRQRRRKAETTAQRQGVELAHALRLATVGEMTAAISHEINQPLGAILTNADAAEMLLDSDQPPGDDLRRILADIRRDDVRASEVVRRIRGLLHKHDVQNETFELGDLVRDTVQLTGGEAHRRRITIELDPSTGPLHVQGDRVQLQQLLLNLIINAMDAMADTPAAFRRVSVRVSREEPGNVEVAVSDYGHGIAAGTTQKIFDSFYTTKPNGLGLGLSIVRTIAEAHGGSIRAANNAAAGATFHLTLPEARAEVQQSSATQNQVSQARAT